MADRELTERIKAHRIKMAELTPRIAETCRAFGEAFRRSPDQPVRDSGSSPREDG